MGTLTRFARSRTHTNIRLNLASYLGHHTVSGRKRSPKAMNVQWRVETHGHGSLLRFCVRDSSGRTASASEQYWSE
jgi:hypothetical protein